MMSGVYSCQIRDMRLVLVVGLLWLPNAREGQRVVDLQSVKQDSSPPLRGHCCSAVTSCPHKPRCIDNPNPDITCYQGPIATPTSQHDCPTTTTPLLTPSPQPRSRFVGCVKYPACFLRRHCSTRLWLPHSLMTSTSRSGCARRPHYAGPPSKLSRTHPLL